MKRLIWNGLLFIVICSVLYAAAFWSLCSVDVGGTPLIYRVSEVLNWKGGNTYLKFREFQEGAHYDVVFIGSSHANRGYDPSIFEQHGYTSFNLGTSAQSPMNTYYIIKEFLYGGNTGLLVIDVYEAAMEMNGLESTADLTQNITSEKAAIGMAWGVKDPRAINMLALRYLRRDAGPMFNDNNYSRLGFTGKADSVKTDIHYVHGKDFEPFNVQKRYLRKTIEMCLERNMKVVFVNHPYPHQSDREKHRQFNTYISDLTEQYGIEYLDHAYDHELDDNDHFYDHNHLNTAGVSIYNPRLIRELQQKGILKMP